MAWFTKGKEGFLAGDIDADAHKFTAALIDMNTAGPASGAYVITNVTYSAPNVTVTTSAAHGMTTGDRVEIFNVGGATGINSNNSATGYWTLASGSGTTFTVNTGVSPGTYTSGGFALDLSIQFLSELNVSGTAVVGTAVEIPTAGRTVTNGILDLPDVTFTSVTGASVEALVVIKAGNTPGGASDAASAQRLVLAQTPVTSGISGLPVTPNGGNINVTWAAQGVGEL